MDEPILQFCLLIFYLILFITFYSVQLYKQVTSLIPKNGVNDTGSHLTPTLTPPTTDPSSWCRSRRGKPSASSCRCSDRSDRPDSWHRRRRRGWSTGPARSRPAPSSRRAGTPTPLRTTRTRWRHWCRCTCRCRSSASWENTRIDGETYRSYLNA